MTTAASRMKDVADQIALLSYNTVTGGTFINWRGDWVPTGTVDDQNLNTDYNTDGSTDGGRTPITLTGTAGSGGAPFYYRVSMVVTGRESIPTVPIGPFPQNGATLTWAAGQGTPQTYKVARSSDGVTFNTLCEAQFTSDGPGATQPTGNTLTVTGAGWHRNQWAGHFVTILGNSRFGALCSQVASNTGTADGDSTDTITLAVTWQPSSGTTTVPPPSTYFCVSPAITSATWTDTGTLQAVSQVDYQRSYRHDTATDITCYRTALEAKARFCVGSYDAFLRKAGAAIYAEWSRSSAYKSWPYFEMVALDRLEPNRGWDTAAAYNAASVFTLNYHNSSGIILDTATFPASHATPQGGWSWQGAYSSAVAYNYPQAVSYLGLNYWATGPIPSGSGLDPVANSTWRLMPTYRTDYAWESVAVLADAAVRFPGRRVTGLHGGFSTWTLQPTDLFRAVDRATVYLLSQLNPTTMFPAQQMDWLYPLPDQPSAGLNIVKTGEWGQILDMMCRVQQIRPSAALLTAIRRMVNVAFAVSTPTGSATVSPWWDSTNGSLWGEISWDGTAPRNGPVGSYKEGGRQVHILRGLTRLAIVDPGGRDASGTKTWAQWRDQYLSYAQGSLGWTVAGHALGSIYRLAGDYSLYVDPNTPKSGVTGNWRGLYLSANSYAAGDVVSTKTASYQALNAVAAGNGNDPASLPGSWQVVPGAYASEFWSTSEAMGITGVSLADYLHLTGQ